LGFVDGPSTYSGFGNDPVNMGDPLGLQQEFRVTKTKRYDPADYPQEPQISYNPELGSGCPSSWRDKIEAAAEELWQALPYCVDFERVEQIQDKLSHLEVVCLSTKVDDNHCAQAGYPFQKNLIGFKSSALVGRCGQPARVVLHETLHNLGEKHDVVSAKDKHGNVIKIRILEEFDCFEPVELSAQAKKEIEVARRERSDAKKKAKEEAFKP
jgi:hypothetical protein